MRLLLLTILGLLCLSGAPLQNSQATNPGTPEIEEAPQQMIYELPECVPVKITSVSL